MNGRNWDRWSGYGGDFRARGYDGPMPRPRGYDAPMQRTGYDAPMRGYPQPRYDAGMRGGMQRGYDIGYAPQNRGRYGGRDFWWLGERAMPPRRPGSDYDRGFRSFDEQHHPRFSPVGGMYPHVGGGYAAGSMPRPIREGTWFSDWTRWF